MTNLDSILKSRDITSPMPTKVHLVKAVVLNVWRQQKGGLLRTVTLVFHAKRRPDRGRVRFSQLNLQLLQVYLGPAWTFIADV